jgi:Holliday junction resolvase
MRNENAVKTRIRSILDAHGWKHWPNSAGSHSVSGLPDRFALKAGQFMAIEAKFGSNKATALQRRFLSEVHEQGGWAFVVNEKNVHLLENCLEPAIDYVMDREELEKGWRE